ncbi:DNA ligase 1-like [Dorcoceras hygrometricum]|uniref:DNA ligase 1-like n=1 Tax=Dorcoceras hygrometricum TaxID=472368 RepID=A0A2Z7DBA0_9LAMI|nr:DNA ligase 1-like [Dorcoceras hygrometricum]
MRRHTDRGFLLKTQPDLHLAVHVSLYQRLEYDVTRIMVSFRTMDFTSDPDLSYTKSYTSILCLGLAVGDTPDVSYYHLGTRGPSSALQARPTLLRSKNLPRTRYDIGRWPEDMCSDSERFPRTMSYLPESSPDTSSLFEESGDDTSFLSSKKKHSPSSSARSPTISARRPDARALDVVEALD